ncbi:MAG: methylmalonyl Co-A mutase-associated GTPase MeaB [Candidatus Edwardsbacteria bacterium]|nr:methylmalonyl Co-A mutase-associated GTPase MeaB [Candidatus Edwardsbacteria bacterium]
MMDLNDGIIAGDVRALARAISLVENGDPAAVPLLRALFPRTGAAYLLGITGPPGGGKSTLVDRLIAHYRGRGLRVGVIAVDPSSPFSGGAILGDRVRMQKHATDPGVFIRSMGSRGHLGGLAAATADAAAVLDAGGCGIVILETVGIGQSEVEVAGMVDTTVLVTVPGLGDDVQVLKAGTMEIADIFAVNKADRDGVEKCVIEIEQLLGVREMDESTFLPPIVQLVARDGKGIAELADAVERHRAYLSQHGRLERRRNERLRRQVRAIITGRLGEWAHAKLTNDVEAGENLADLYRRKTDPHTVAAAVLRELGID